MKVFRCNDEASTDSQEVCTKFGCLDVTVSHNGLGSLPPSLWWRLKSVPGLAEEASPNGMTRCDNGAQIHKTLFKLSPREPNNYAVASALLCASKNVGSLPYQPINRVSRTLSLTIIAVVGRHFQGFGTLEDKMSVLAD